MRGTHHGRQDGVPLRFPRPVAALVATATAAVTVGLSAAPAHADQVRLQEWWLNALNVTNAWTASQGAGVTVAVLSDGVDASHPDLTGVVTTAPAPAGAPVATGQFYGEQGTGIASLIAGHGDGSGGASGILGVAPAARILSVPVTLPADDGQLYQSSVAATIPAAIAAGIRYAVDHGATVIDLPIDPGQPSNGQPGDQAAAGGSTAEQSAVQYALQHNVVLVAPAGDDELTTDAPNYPAAYPGVIAVGAINSVDVKPPWTNRQTYVTLLAAGAGVTAASNSGGYQTMNSTSAASAMVAGVVALIRSRYPNLSVAAIRTALISTTTYRRTNGLKLGSGYGVVNAAPALGAAGTLATTPKERAGANAQPLATLGPAAAGPGAAKLSPQILRAGELSAAVLVLLLLVVAAYAAIRRRRRTGARPAIAAEWTAVQAQSRYPHAVVTTEADRMLEYFAAPTAPPTDTTAQQALPARPAAAGYPSRADSAEEKAFVPSAGTGDGSRLVPYGSTSGAVAKRAPVSGTPPWEPASPPDGALPWSDTPGKQMVAGHVVESGPAAAEPAADEPTAPPSSAPPIFGPSTFAPPTSGLPTSALPASAGPNAAEPVLRRVRPDWRRAHGPASESARSAAQSGRDDHAHRETRPAPGQADRQPPISWPDRPAPVAWSDRTATGSVTGSVPDAGLAREPRRTEASPPEEEAAPPSQHRSGLPIRQPRSVGRAAMSPSGSLWESSSGGGSLWERAEVQDPEAPDAEPDGNGRPMFVWEPPGVGADNQTGRSAD